MIYTIIIWHMPQKSIVFCNITHSQSVMHGFHLLFIFLVFESSPVCNGLICKPQTHHDIHLYIITLGYQPLLSLLCLPRAHHSPQFSYLAAS